MGLRSRFRHLSEQGADTVLLWNPSFLVSSVRLSLAKKAVNVALQSRPWSANPFAGALVQQVNAQCPDCPAGIDLTQANFSISVFARSLLANCEQVGQIIYNQYRPASRPSGDIWGFWNSHWSIIMPACHHNALQRTICQNRDRPGRTFLPRILRKAAEQVLTTCRYCRQCPPTVNRGIGDLLSTPEPRLTCPHPPIRLPPANPHTTRIPATSTPNPSPTPYPSSTPYP